MPAAGSVHFADYRLDMRNAQLWCGQQLVKLSPKALSVLDCLVNRPGQLVTKDALFAAVWPEVVVSEGTLAECIREVRKALGETARAPRYVETVHRRGYRFIGQLTDPALSSVSSSPPRREHFVVGREAELAQLQGWYAQARAGQRQVVFVAGEAGIGKTTLVEACVEQLQGGGNCWVGHGQCIEQYGAGEAYMPVLEAVGRLCRGPQGREVIAVLEQYAPTWLVQLPSLMEAAVFEALQRKTAGATQQRMLREMAEALEALTVEKPLVLVLEDLHWSDYSTVELLATLARRREAARLLVLGTYRLVEVHLGEHHLKRVKQELQVHGQCEELALDFLSEGAVGDYLSRRFGQDTLPASLRGFIHRHTDGNPLFMVRVTEELVQREVLTEHDGQWELSGALSEETVHVPEGLRQFIEQQFAQLSGAERSLVEAASVAGVEFSAAAVAAGVEQSVEGVEEQCAGLAHRQHFLVDKGTAEWPDGTVAARYGFIHSLYQEVFYARLPPGRRSGLHQRIGVRAEAAYSDRADEIAAELALHFERGRDLPRAIQYLQKAGENALRRSAHREAIGHFTTALEVLRTLPDNPERSQQELTLHVALCPPLSFTKNYGSAEVEQVYTRARELCAQVGEASQLFPALYGVWQVYNQRAEHTAAHEAAKQLLSLAQRVEDSGLLLEAHLATGTSLSMLGEFVSGREHLEAGMALYDPHQHRSHIAVYWRDPGVGGLSVAAWTLWRLGYPDQALESSHQMMTLGEESLHPFSLAWALNFAGFLHGERRESPAAQERAEALIALSMEHGFSVFLAYGTVRRGAALAAQGQAGEGLAQIRQGLAAARATGAGLAQSSILTALAVAHGKAGQAEDGLAAVAEALAFVDRTAERFYEAELYRLKGELSLQLKVESRKPVLSPLRPYSGQASAPLRTGAVEGAKVKRRRSKVEGAKVQEEAEDCFQKALDVARRQSAKSFELRAATSLARLWQQQGKRAEARGVLAPVYGWFTEGFDTADLKDAKALLDQLTQT